MNERQKRSRQQEEATAKVHGGRRNAGSGSRWNRKGDVRTATRLIENKRTDGHKQITLKADDLEKIWREAWLDGRMPVLEFELRGRSYVVLTREDDLDREERIRELEQQVAALEGGVVASVRESKRTTPTARVVPARGMSGHRSRPVLPR